MQTHSSLHYGPFSLNKNQCYDTDYRLIRKSSFLFFQMKYKLEEYKNRAYQYCTRVYFIIFISFQLIWRLIFRVQQELDCITILRE